MSDKENPERIPWLPVMILVVGAFMSVLDGSIVNVALPRMMTVFGASTDEIQWVLTGYLLASGVIIPLTGFLSSRFGNKKMYIFSLVIFTFGSALCGISWSTTTMIFSRIIQALGGGMLIPISMSMLYLIVPEKKIGVAMGVWGISAVMGPAIGPTLGGYLVDNLGWPWIFTINIPFGAAAALLAWRYLQETPVQKDLRPDIWGTVFIVIGCFSLLLALSQGQEKGWYSQYIVTLYIVAVFSLVLFILAEKSAANPLIDLRIFKNPVMLACMIGTGFTTVLVFAVVFLIPIYAQNLLGYSPVDTGLLMLPMSLTIGLLMVISGKLFDRFGPFWPSVTGIIILISFTYYLRHLSLDTSYGRLQFLLALRAVGIGLCMMPIANAGMATMPAHLTAIASAALNLIRQIAGSMGIALTTYLLLNRQAYHLGVFSDAFSYSSSTSPYILGQLQGWLAAQGLSGDVARQGAVGLIYSAAVKQSYMNSIDDALVILSLLSLIALPALFLLTNKKIAEEKMKSGLLNPDR